MITFLDLLVIVGLVLIASSMLSVVLMFLIRNRIVRRVCFYVTVALSIYIGYVGVRINWLDFAGQAFLAVVFVLVSLSAFGISFVRWHGEKFFLAARIASAAALVLGVVNALLI